MKHGIVEKEIKFGTSGWRGIIGKDLTEDNVALAAQGICNYLKKRGGRNKKIIVGYDTRRKSAKFAAIASNVLKNNKFNVLLTDRDTPTPVIAFHIIKDKCAAAINITASHNPYDYNGIKYSSAYGGPASAEVTLQIEKEISKLQKAGKPIKYNANTSKIKKFNPEPSYLKHISKKIDFDLIKKSKIKIVIDCMHGTSRGYLDYILKKHDIKTVVINNTIDTSFEGHGPNPSKEMLQKLKRVIKKNKADLGLATDGDADRFGILDREGNYIAANKVLALVFEHLLKTRKHKGGVVRSITTTRLLDSIAKHFGRKTYEVPVGFKYIGSTLISKKAILGGEESGGLTIYDHIPDKDGILACLLIAELVAMRKKTLKQILNEIGNKYGRFYAKRADLKLKPKTMQALLDSLKKKPLKHLSGLKVSKYLVLPKNNFKIEFIDGSWIIIRPSGTEPILRCYLETRSSETVPKLEKGLRVLTKI